MRKQYERANSPTCRSSRYAANRHRRLNNVYTRKPSVSKRALRQLRRKKKRRDTRAMDRAIKREELKEAREESSAEVPEETPGGTVIPEILDQQKPAKKPTKLTLAQKKRKEKNVAIWKERRKRRKRKWARQRRKRFHMLARKSRKKMLTERAQKMSVEELRRMIARLVRKRRRKALKFRRHKMTTCKRRRQAVRALRRGARAARHRQKKYLRYCRGMEKIAVANLVQLTKTDREREKRDTYEFGMSSRRGKMEEDGEVRVVYPKNYLRKVTMNAPEIVSKEVHVGSDDKALLDLEPYRFRYDVVGNTGIVEARCLSKPRDEEPAPEIPGVETKTKSYVYKCVNPKPPADFRWKAQLTHDQCGLKEARILAQLNQNLSKNALRVFGYGQCNNLQYVLTTKSDISLSDVIKQCPKMDIQYSVYLAKQMLYCIRDMHKIGYAHLQVRPSSFTIMREQNNAVCFSAFTLAKPLEDIFNENEIVSEFRLKALNSDIRQSLLPENQLDVYMSRRQHFRLIEGTADDFESWFYLCARIVNGEPLPWEKATDHFRMAMAKYDYPLIYRHPNAMTQRKMKIMFKYALSGSELKSEKVAYFLQRFLETWQASLPPCKAFPWTGKKRGVSVIEKPSKAVE